MSDLNLLTDEALLAKVYDEDVRSELRRRLGMADDLLKRALWVIDVDGSEGNPETADLVDDLYGYLGDDFADHPPVGPEHGD